MSVLVVDVEKPTAGGRMLARHAGQVVLVWGAIPGERVRARVERSGKGVLFAETVEVVAASPDRRDAVPDWRCGGNVLAHVAYERQTRLKAEIIKDAFGRIARMPQAPLPEVIASPERGYRMRARLHAQGGRLGFYREGTHHLCDAAGTGQLLPETGEWIAAAERMLARDRLDGLAALELAENVAADERACHLELRAEVDAAPFRVLAETGLKGLSAERADRPGVECLSGTPAVADVIHVRIDDPGWTVRLVRDVRAFFQGNRFLLDRLVREVVQRVPAGPVVDLYAGVGLFGLALAAAGFDAVTLVEADPISGASLDENAAPFRDRVRVERRSVEAFLRTRPPDPLATVVIDPPRTGVSPEAIAGLIRSKPARIVYVSCDVATLARDARRLVDAGYGLEGLTGIDLFPNTAHVETVATFTL